MFLMKVPYTQLFLARLWCPILHKVHQITSSKKYVILIYKRFNFPNFHSFPAVFGRMHQKYKWLSKFAKEKFVLSAFQFFTFFFSPNRINGFDCWGPTATLETKISKYTYLNIFDVTWAIQHQLTFMSNDTSNYIRGGYKKNHLIFGLLDQTRLTPAPLWFWAPFTGENKIF